MSYQHSNNKIVFSSVAIKMPVTEELVELSGGQVRYFKMGTGPPLILVHGLGSASVNWYKNIDGLSKSNSVYAVDLPGHGKTYKSISKNPLDQAVTFMIEFMDVMNINKASMVGNSMGGLLALALTLKHPDRVSKLVLEGSAGLRKDIAWFLRFMTLPGIGEIITTPTRKTTKSLLKQILYDTSLIKPNLIEMIYQFRKEPGNRAAMLAIIRTGVSLKGLDTELIFIDRLAEIKVPILLLWGRNDKIVPVHHAEYAANYAANIQLHIFERCGHWPHMEFHEEFNDLVVDFCAEAL
jgi:4,5:9,10-diseco-3-hydroxy-5,9,17-trioxoandrosta-1(10),2-diene-4-oate hydrolase